MLGRFRDQLPLDFMKPIRFTIKTGVNSFFISIDTEQVIDDIRKVVDEIKEQRGFKNGALTDTSINVKRS